MAIDPLQLLSQQDALAAADEQLAADSPHEVADAAAAVEHSQENSGRQQTLAQRMGLSPRAEPTDGDPSHHREHSGPAAGDSVDSLSLSASRRAEIEAQIQADPAAAAAALAAEQRAALLQRYRDKPAADQAVTATAEEPLSETVAAAPDAQPAPAGSGNAWQQFVEQQKSASRPLAPGGQHNSAAVLSVDGPLCF